MNEKNKVKNNFFELILLIISFFYAIIRAFLLFLFNKKNLKNKNLFNDFLDFIFRKWPKYFWKKATLYKLFSLPGNILNYIFSLKGGKSGEIGIKLTKSLIDNEKRKKVTDGRYTSIARKNLACLYNDVRKYDKSYKICIELIYEIMDGDNIFLLMNLLSCLIEADEGKGNIEQAKELCHDLFYISELYERYDSEMVRTYYEKHFDKNIRWY